MLFPTVFLIIWQSLQHIDQSTIHSLHLSVSFRMVGGGVRHLNPCQPMKFCEEGAVEFSSLVMMYPGWKTKTRNVLMEKFLCRRLARFVLCGIGLGESGKMVCHQPSSEQRTTPACSSAVTGLIKKHSLHNISFVYEWMISCNKMCAWKEGSHLMAAIVMTSCRVFPHTRNTLQHGDCVLCCHK